MSEYVLIEYKGGTSTRTVVHYTPLSTLKQQATIALKNRLDRVVIQDGHLNWSRSRGDTKWVCELTAAWVS